MSEPRTLDWQLGNYLRRLETLEQRMARMPAGLSTGGYRMSLEQLYPNFFPADSTGRAKFAAGLVNDVLLAAGAVTTAKLVDGAVTLLKTLFPSINVENMLINPDFEVDSDGTFPPDNWTYYANSGTCSVTRDSSKSREGKYSIKFAASGSPTIWHQLVSNFIPCEPGQKYVLKGYYYADGAQPCIELWVNWFDKDQTYIGGDGWERFTATAGSWQRLERALNATHADARYIRVYVGYKQDSGSATNLWMDSIGVHRQLTFADLFADYLFPWAKMVNSILPTGLLGVFGSDYALAKFGSNFWTGATGLDKFANGFWDDLGKFTVNLMKGFQTKANLWSPTNEAGSNSEGMYSYAFGSGSSVVFEAPEITLTTGATAGYYACAALEGFKWDFGKKLWLTITVHFKTIPSSSYLLYIKAESESHNEIMGFFVSGGTLYSYTVHGGTTEQKSIQSVSQGDVLTLEFQHLGSSCVPYVNGVMKTAHTLQVPTGTNKGFYIEVQTTTSSSFVVVVQKIILQAEMY